MIQQLTFKGLWFIPDNPDRKVHGILKYDYENNVCILELIGSLYDYSKFGKEEIILGITTEGEDITLTECYFSSSTGILDSAEDKPPKWKDGQLPTLDFTITTILKGQHIWKIEDLVFQKIYTEIFNLDEWVGISGLEIENNFAQRSKTISYKTPETIRVQINEDVFLEIKFLTNHPMRSRFTKELKLTQRTILSLHTEKYKTLPEFIYLLRKFNNFISTSLQRPLRIQNIELYCNKFTREVQGDIEIPTPIIAYQIINPELKFDRKRQDWEMLFTYNDIQLEFEIIIKKWFNNYDKFEEPFNLVLSQFYNSQHYLESMFLSVAQAAESFHRRLDLKDDVAKVEQDEEFENKVSKTIECVPEELKNWVKSQISKPPKHFYDTRLKYLLKNYSNKEFDKVLGNHLEFAKRVSISRNYFTHYNSDLEKVAAHGEELILLFHKLQLLLVFAFLIESGFEKSKLEKFTKEKAFSLLRHLRN